MSEMITVLVVDDEALVANIVEASLQDAGFEVIVAANGEEAIAMLQRQAEIGGLITDVNLGSGISGFDVAHRARELMPELPVIYMTGQSAAAWASQGVPNSVLMHKPFVGAQIITALSSLLNVTGA